MKVDRLKNIIKEAVKEAVREEIKDILNEAVSNASQTTVKPATIKRSLVKETLTQPEPVSKSDDPIMAMLNMTKQNMTRDDFKNINQGNAPVGNVLNGTGGMNFVTETATQPGIDISKLDFVGKAAQIFNQAKEKDKFRVGG